MRKYIFTTFFMSLGFFLNAQSIHRGQNIDQNRKYWADDKRSYLIFQNDGNLVFYNRVGKAIWDSKTTNRGAKAVFQDDGNLVVYTNRNGVAFSSNTGGRNADRLAIQDDGNLVIYNRNNPLWASNTNKNSNGNGNKWGFRGESGSVNPGYEFRRNNKVYSSNRNFYLVFQNDGNLVLSRNNGQAIWSTQTTNKASKAEFQDDGNLVVYDSYNKAVWSSNSSRRGATRLDIQNDGNLVIYQNSSPIWSSGTGR
ncbi:bulb-type lectin domain-containing protein [Chryseobacterium sp. C39-AII1]|uniref:bulb-type lectin domain-containing protein n=1 Tax=Chryseobacterium sp. C39-AII1 TaxID=3080332 RepID=UPI00320AF514